MEACVITILQTLRYGNVPRFGLHLHNQKSSYPLGLGLRATCSLLRLLIFATFLMTASYLDFVDLSCPLWTESVLGGT